jgi:hypothetical protein
VQGKTGKTLKGLDCLGQSHEKTKESAFTKNNARHFKKMAGHLVFSFFKI